MKKSIRRVITATAVGAGLGYMASKGAFVDPGMPDALQAAMNAKLPSAGTASGVGAALGATAMTAYDIGKHRALGSQWDK
jgi:hypothetical protein